MGNEDRERLLRTLAASVHCGQCTCLPSNRCMSVGTRCNATVKSGARGFCRGGGSNASRAVVAGAAPHLLMGFALLLRASVTVIHRDTCTVELGAERSGGTAPDPVLTLHNSGPARWPVFEFVSCHEPNRAISGRWLGPSLEGRLPKSVQNQTDKPKSNSDTDPPTSQARPFRTPPCARAWRGRVRERPMHHADDLLLPRTLGNQIHL